MINFVEYLGIPTTIAVSLVGLFFIIQIIGEILEFKGKVVPEFIKIRKYFDRKKKEQQALSQISVLLDEHNKMVNALTETNRLLGELDRHYNKDNIAKRDKWMKEVDQYISDNEIRREEQDALMRELNEKLDKNNSVTLSILIENKRGSIIDFASRVIDENYPVTKEQFNRIFKIYKEYEEIIKEHKLTNGEVDIAIHIIQESYEQHMKNHTFIEDVRGYGV